ncbi:hypothetical protein [Sphingomonas desiccabilis]|uniref:Uncharacterized protein n=1 Tax=Sphingomonas desiccabilis TaxID=429134 RepID=A0A4Q2IVT2_9SPHN|nr:hypothetical protein [Sphingomonas desiccabilis]MBB3910160.1 hypothetical protein [Sphingomonas desiccabilis]RXZ34839.1 hypothetical protein EO081_04045 [Sphingomonas desiccabilis]
MSLAPRKSRSEIPVEDREMDDVGEDMVETYQTLGRILEAILVEGKVERTPKIRELLNDHSTMVIHALGCRPRAN